MNPKVHTVIVADILKSRRRVDLRSLLDKKIAAASSLHRDKKLISLPYAVTAGDEFQTVATQPSALPAILFDLRRLMQPFSLRIGVGMGRINERVKAPVNHLSGEAFESARKAIESIKQEVRFTFQAFTAFQTSNPLFNETANLLYGLHDTLAFQITDKQWETINAYIESPTVKKTARRLKLNISTVSRNLKRGYYWQLSETVKVAESLIRQVFP
jgi:hypothetical protein